MRLAEFNTMNLSNQVKTVFNKGAYIADRIEKDFTVVLYKLSHFCVELYYHEADSEPTTLRTFNCPEKLTPYFEDVRLASFV